MKIVGHARILFVPILTNSE